MAWQHSKTMNNILRKAGNICQKVSFHNHLAGNILYPAKVYNSGLQKYEQPTKVFCLSENLGEYFSEIKSPSNLKKFCHFERRDVISQICSTSTIYKFSRVQSSMIELFVFIVICGCTAMVYSKLILLLFSQ